ncbi:hypothetical protein FKW77_000227 [Venturia effusa]|uniref:Uncharacterized protein n=1 Tax=Venturia effusa TaxID=50376 RepID=A0A517LA64_9PEZI|nr:hypothetical protein FKW77_000227 [Venturia effusa]
MDHQTAWNPEVTTSAAQNRQSLSFEQERQRIKFFEELEKRAKILKKQWRDTLRDKEQEYEDFTADRFATIRNIVGMMHKLLPREVRDMIYTQLYQHAGDISLFARPLRFANELSEAQRNSSIGDSNRNLIGWPEDCAGLLNRDIVGFETSQEAAKIFYSCNRFLIRGTLYMSELRQYDHYNSGSIPIHEIHHLILHVERLPSHLEPHLNPYRWYKSHYGGSAFPDNKVYLYHQSRDRVRHEMETLFGLLEGYRRHPVTLEIYDYRRKKGQRDLRDSIHHLITLKKQGISVVLKIQRKFVPLEPYPHEIDELGFQDISSYLERPTEEEKTLFQRPLHSQARRHLIRNRSRKVTKTTIEMPCESLRTCPGGDSRKCSDLSRHAGWYRALFHDLAERTLERELLDPDFDTCKFCPDERLVEEHQTMHLEIDVPRIDPDRRWRGINT